MRSQSTAAARAKPSGSGTWGKSVVVVPREVQGEQPWGESPQAFDCQSKRVLPVSVVDLAFRTLAG